MAIDSSKAERAHDFLMKMSPQVEIMAEQARLKENMLKHTEGLLVKAMANQNIPVGVREKYARAEDKFKEAVEEDAKAYAQWKRLCHDIDLAKIAIGMWQSQIKDRM